MKMFILGFGSALLLIVAIFVVVFLVAVNTSRADAATIIINVYEQAVGHDVPEVVTPFEDTGNLPASEQSSISKLYGLGITAGTSASTFSPNDRTKLYQWFIFAGKLLMRLEVI